MSYKYFDVIVEVSIVLKLQIWLDIGMTYHEKEYGR